MEAYTHEFYSKVLNAIYDPCYGDLNTDPISSAQEAVENLKTNAFANLRFPELIEGHVMPKLFALRPESPSEI